MFVISTRIKSLVMAIGCVFSINTMAGNISYKESYPTEEYHPWSIIGSAGYTWFNFGYNGDGETPIGRFALARDFGTPIPCLHFGAELGIQNGNTMRLDISQETLDLLGGAPIQVNIKPMLDLLATATIKPFAIMSAPIFFVAKAGVAYRRMQVEDRVTVNDLSQTAFEAQAGLGVILSNRINISLVYQGVFNGGTDFTVNTTNDTGHISNIPNQNGFLLSVAYDL